MESAAPYYGRMMRFLGPLLALFLVAPAYAADPPAVKTTAEIADELYSRLAKTADEDEAAGIVTALEAMALRSNSDTDDLLMSRAQAALAADDDALAQSLLDTVVAVDPDWAEGWNARATARFHAGDLEGSAADIAETLKRNPRHIGAFAGLAVIFAEAGQRDNALKVYDRALALAPAYKPLVEPAEKLRRALAGQAL